MDTTSSGRPVLILSYSSMYVLRQRTIIDESYPPIGLRSTLQHRLVWRSHYWLLI